jgi:hypothetical protein
MEAVIRLFERPPRLVRRAKYAPEFLEAMRGRKFRNPDSGNEVVFETLSESEQKRIHDYWMRARQREAPPEKPKPKRNIPEEALKATRLTPNKDPARYEGVDVQYGGLGEDSEEVKKKVHSIVGKAAEKMGTTPEQYVTDLAGGGGVGDMLSSVELRVNREGGIEFSGSGEQVKHMDRDIYFSPGGSLREIRNKHLELSDDAPEGTGTRILATQVAALQESGGYQLSTTGSGCFDCDYKGYYVWPLLGFDGELPEDDLSELPRDLYEELVDTGGGPPFHISELMSFDEGREWWLENGAELELEFKADNDDVLQSYVAKKAAQAGKSVGQFIHNASKKKPRGKSDGSADKVEQAPNLSKEDQRILGEIWDGLRKKRKGKTMTTKNSTQALVDLAQENPAFRDELLGELVKDASASNVKDFTIDEFSQHNMLRNLRGGDLIEILYSPNPVHPQRIATRLVDSDFDPAIPGVLLRGMEGQELLADRGQGMPLIWEPGTGQPGLPVLELKLVRHQLRMAEEDEGKAPTAQIDSPKADKKASLSEEAVKIIDAMGGADHLAKMLGARNFESSEWGMSFEWPNRRQEQGNKVAIERGPKSTYVVTFFNKSASGEEKLHDLHQIYAEKLASTFEKHTGWFLRV